MSLALRVEAQKARCFVKNPRRADSPTAVFTAHRILLGSNAVCVEMVNRLFAQAHTVCISEDAWLAALYPDELRSVQDYVRLSERLRTVMTPHIVSLLTAGTSVVLDFPANTLSTRAWARSLFEQAGAAHCLHFLDVSDAECKQRLRLRNAAGEHAFQASDAQFDLITQYFVPPTAQEGFHLIRHG